MTDVSILYITNPYRTSAFQWRIILPRFL